jgi:hypothetical protein
MAPEGMMMRCLRCAIDYPPEERYCHRCGRALSRPPGSKDQADSEQFSTLQDTQYLYSTFSPPSAGGVAQIAVEMEHDAPSASPPPLRPGLPPSAALARPPVGKRAEAALPPSAPSYPTPDADGMYASTRQALPALPGGVYIPPPTDPNASSWEETAEKRVDPVDNLDDEEDVLAAFRVKPAAIGIDAGSWRKKAAIQRSMPNLPKLERQMLVAIVAALVLVFGGGVALWRHATYSSNLQDAQRYEQAGQYPAAIDKYNAAINAWPFNADAQNGRASAQATAVVVDAAATAVTLRAQAQATAVVMRKTIYSVRVALRQQIAAQADADAIATATASAPH